MENGNVKLLFRCLIITLSHHLGTHVWLKYCVNIYQSVCDVISDRGSTIQNVIWSSPSLFEHYSERNSIFWTSLVCLSLVGRLQWNRVPACESFNISRAQYPYLKQNHYYCINRKCLHWNVIDCWDTWQTMHFTLHIRTLKLAGGIRAWDNFGDLQLEDIFQVQLLESLTFTLDSYVVWLLLNLREVEFCHFKEQFYKFKTSTKWCDI